MLHSLETELTNESRDMRQFCTYFKSVGISFSIIMIRHWKMASSFELPCDLAWKPLHALQDSSHMSLRTSLTIYIVGHHCVYKMCLHQHISWLAFYTLQFCIVLYMLFAYVVDIIAYTITDFVNAQTICTFIFCHSVLLKVMSSMTEPLYQKIMSFNKGVPEADGMEILFASLIILLIKNKLYLVTSENISIL